MFILGETIKSRLLINARSIPQEILRRAATADVQQPAGKCRLIESVGQPQQLRSPWRFYPRIPEIERFVLVVREIHGEESRLIYAGRFSQSEIRSKGGFQRTYV
jgi:hypothetical protein